MTPKPPAPVPPTLTAVAARGDAGQRIATAPGALRLSRLSAAA